MPGAERRRILLAEDERVVRLSLSALLSGAGYEVDAVRDGEEAVRRFRADPPDLVLLDVMMPGTDGLAACRRIRETDAATPVVFLTALDSDAAQLRGLGAGADDYVAKSASEEVLLARVAAALRRRDSAAPSGDFDFGSCRVSARNLELRAADGSRVPLKERDVAVLRLFAEHPREAFSRDFLLTRFWPADADITDNALSVYIASLRSRLGEDGRLLESVRGVGYAYRPD